MSLLPAIKSIDVQVECEIALDYGSPATSGAAISSKGLELITPQQFSAGSMLEVSIIDEKGACQEVTAVVADSEPCHCHPGSFFTTIAFVEELAGGSCACNHSVRGALVLPA